MGWGGIILVVKVIGLFCIIIYGGMDNFCKLDGIIRLDYSDWICEFGGGCKLLEEKDLILLIDLELGIEFVILGDLEFFLKWILKSVVKLVVGLN